MYSSSLSVFPLPDSTSYDQDPMIFFLFQNNTIRQVTPRKNANMVEKPMIVPDKLLSLTFGYLECVPSWTQLNKEIKRMDLSESFVLYN